jgi:hypothetical protein
MALFVQTTVAVTSLCQPLFHGLGGDSIAGMVALGMEARFFANVMYCRATVWLVLSQKLTWQLGLPFSGPATSWRVVILFLICLREEDSLFDFDQLLTMTPGRPSPL